MIGQGLDDISGRQTRLLRRRRCSRRPKKAFRAAGQQRSGQTIDISRNRMLKRAKLPDLPLLTLVVVFLPTIKHI